MSDRRRALVRQRNVSRRRLEAMSSCPETAREINRIQLALLHETDRAGRQMLLDELFRVEQFLSPVPREIALLNSASDRLKPIPSGKAAGTIGPERDAA